MESSTRDSSTVWMTACSAVSISRLAACQLPCRAQGHGHGQVLLVRDLLLVLSEGGELYLVRLNPDKLEELAQLAVLSSKTWNNPALAGSLLLMRNDREAVAYELPLAK